MTNKRRFTGTFARYAFDGINEGVRVELSYFDKDGADVFSVKMVKALRDVAVGFVDKDSKEETFAEEGAAKERFHQWAAEAMDMGEVECEEEVKENQTREDMLVAEGFKKIDRKPIEDYLKNKKTQASEKTLDRFERSLVYDIYEKDDCFTIYSSFKNVLYEQKEIAGIIGKKFVSAGHYMDKLGKWQEWRIADDGGIQNW